MNGVYAGARVGVMSWGCQERGSFVLSLQSIGWWMVWRWCGGGMGIELHLICDYGGESIYLRI